MCVPYVMYENQLLDFVAENVLSAEFVVPSTGFVFVLASYCGVTLYYY